jgi:hypothetical protein
VLNFETEDSGRAGRHIRLLFAIASIGNGLLVNSLSWEFVQLLRHAEGIVCGQFARKPKQDILNEWFGVELE